MPSPKFIKLTAAVIDGHLRYPSQMYLNVEQIVDIMRDEEAGNTEISTTNGNTYYVKEDVETILIRIEG